MNFRHLHLHAGPESWEFSEINILGTQGPEVTEGSGWGPGPQVPYWTSEEMDKEVSQVVSCTCFLGMCVGILSLTLDTSFPSPVPPLQGSGHQWIEGQLG